MRTTRARWPEASLHIWSVSDAGTSGFTRLRRDRGRLRAERPRGGDRAGARRDARCWSSRRRRRSGGGMRSAELTLPGFLHDVCSAVHPLVAGLAVPVARCRCASHGLELLPPGRAAGAPARRRHGGGARALARRDRRLDRRRATGAPTARSWSRSCATPGCCCRSCSARCARRGTRLPLARFGLRALRSATGLARGALPRRARPRPVRGLRRPLDAPPRAARLGRRSAWCSRCWRTPVGWPIARGGSQRSPTRWPSHLRSLGGEIRTDSPVDVARRAAAGPSRAARPDAAPGAAGGRAAAARPLPARARAATATARASSSSTGRSTARSRGPRRSAAAPGPCTWAARSTRSRPPSARSRGARARSGRSCCWRSRACSTDRARAGGQARGLGLLPRAARLGGWT